VTATDVVVALVGTLETREPGRADFAGEEWTGVETPQAASRRVIVTTPRATLTNALNRADGRFGGWVRLGKLVATTLSVVSQLLKILRV